MINSNVKDTFNAVIYSPAHNILKLSKVLEQPWFATSKMEFDIQ